MFYLMLLLLCIIILLIVFFLALDQDLFSPTILMCIMFFFSTFVAILNAEKWNINYSFNAFFLISSGIFFFGITEVIISKYIKKSFNLGNLERKAKIIYIEKWKVAFTIIIDLLILYLYYQGMKSVVLNSGNNLANLQSVYRKITSYESAGNMSMWILMTVKFLDATAYIFLYTFINNLVIAKQKITKNIFLIFPAFIFCIKTLLSGGRQDILKLTFFGIVTSYILYQQKFGWKLKIAFKYIVIGIVTILIMTPLFYYALELTGRNSTRSIFQVLSTYIGGSIQHFNQFIQDPIDKSSFWGNECFTPILNMLGKLNLIDYHNTVHLEFRRLGETMGNIYTFFRRPLQDFGVLGMYVFTIIISIFFSLFYYLKIKNRNQGYNQDKKNIYYSYLLYWIILSSIEQYSMTIVSAYTVLAIVTLRICGYFYFRINISKGKIYIKNADRSSG